MPRYKLSAEERAAKAARKERIRELTSSYSHIEKRESRYLRYALFNAAKFVCNWDETFAAYLAKKRAEGKHYNVAVSHACKKLVRVIYHLQTTGETYRC